MTQQHECMAFSTHDMISHVQFCRDEMQGQVVSLLYGDMVLPMRFIDRFGIQS